MFNYVFIIEFNMPKEDSSIYEGSPCWMDKRMELFESYTLPSLNSQTDNEFYAFLVCDPDTPEVYKQKLHQLEENYKFIHIFWSKRSDGEEADKGIIDLYKKLSPNQEQILTSICDNDDLVHIQYVETAKLIYNYLEQGITQIPFIRDIKQIKQFNLDSVNLINYSHGLYWDINQTKFLDSIFPTNAFFTTKSNINNFLNPRYTNHHDVVKDNNSLICNTILPMWIQIIHGENLWNRLDRMPGNLCDIDINQLKEHYGF